MQISFFAPGHPRPKGSLKHIGNGRMVESTKHSAPWRKVVATHARRVAPEAPLEGPVEVILTFVTPRPKTVTRPKPCTRSSGDLDKLTRLVFDALTDAGVVGDDSQVVGLSAAKIYPDHLFPIPGVAVTVIPLEEDQ